MIEKKTELDQIEVMKNGVVQIRFGLLLVEDGAQIDCKWHRTVIEPGVSVDDQMAAVNSHLVQMGKMAVSVADIDRIKSFTKLAQTPEIVTAFQSKKAGV